MTSSNIYTSLDLKSMLETTILDKNGNISQGKFKSLSLDIINSISIHTQECTGKLTERIYWILYDITDYPKMCDLESCDNKITTFKNGYHQKFCCYSCNATYQLTQHTNPFSGASGILLRKKGMLLKYGVEHNMKTEQSLEKRKKTYFSNYGVDHPNKSPEIKSKIRSTSESKNIWLPKSEMEPFKLYRSEVNRVTNKQPIETLAYKNQRGHSRVKSSYSLDHKFSVQAGFKNNIPPYIIGNICNLEFIPSKDNSSKREACSISLDELLESFFDKFTTINP
jgi:hypothetical protein